MSKSNKKKAKKIEQGTVLIIAPKQTQANRESGQGILDGQREVLNLLFREFPQFRTKSGKPTEDLDVVVQPTVSSPVEVARSEADPRERDIYLHLLRNAGNSVKPLLAVCLIGLDSLGNIAACTSDQFASVEKDVRANIRNSSKFFEPIVLVYPDVVSHSKVTAPIDDDRSQLGA